jgi:lysophospholipase L1-like esterase
LEAVAGLAARVSRSSITHGVGLDTAAEAWPAIFAHDLQASLLNLGWAGSCLISGLASRMVRDQAASLIALELGINVHADGLLKERTFLSSVHSFIAIVREGHPTTPIAIVSPIFCEAAEDTALGNGLSLSRMRSLLAEAVETRRGAGDGRIQLISGLDLLGPADAADLPDGLHPSRNGHAKIASRFRTKAASVGLLDHLPVPGVE